jgi:hypothetical protein
MCIFEKYVARLTGQSIGTPFHSFAKGLKGKGNEEVIGGNSA